MISPLQILYLEDDPRDEELVQASLESGGIACQITRVETELEFSASLEQGGFDLLLADYTLPSFDGISGLKIAKNICPEVPFVFVSGTLGEEVAIETLKLGATDYVLKTRLSRLATSVQRALHEVEEKARRKRAEEALRRSEKELRDLITEMPAMAFSVRPDGSTEFASGRWEDYSTRPEEATQDDGWEATVHPDDLDVHLSKWQASLESGEPFENEVRHRSATGQYRWFLVRAVPLRNDDGLIVKWYGTLTDIEDRKRAEEARQEIEERWKAAFENNPTMCFILGEAGEILSVNAYGAEKLGYTVNELIGQPVLNVFYEPDRQPVQLNANACFEQPGRMMRWEARKIRKDGTMLWVRETANAVILTRRLVLLVVCEDITEQKRAEEAARRSEKELRDAIESVPAMLFVALPGPSNVFVSRRWREYTGLSSEDTAGFGWQSAVHPEDLEHFMENWRISSATGEPLEDEARFRRAADGEYRWFLVRAEALRDEQGNIFKWYGIATDIEDRKRAEEAVRRSENQLRNVIDTIPAVVWSVSPDGALDFANEGWRDMTGLPLDSALGWDWQQVVHPDDRQRFVAEWREALNDGQAMQGEIRVQMHDREYRWFFIRNLPLRDELGRIVKWYGTAIDIEDRKRAEEALRRSEAYLAEAQALTHTGSWVLDPVKEQLLHCSEELFRVYGIDRQISPPPIELLLERMHPDDRDRVRELRIQGERIKVEHAIDYRLLLPDGTIKYIHSIRHPVLNEQGDILEFVGTSMDVTEQKRAEEALRESEELKRRIIESSPNCIKVLDLDGNLLFMSTSGQQLLEIDDIQPYLNTRWIDFWQPEDRPKANKAVAAAKTGGIGKFQAFCRSAKGNPRWWDVIVTPICNPAGQPEQLLAVSRDITEHKRAEETLRRSEAYLTEAQRLTGTGSWVWDPRTDKLLYCSEELYRMFDVARVEGPRVELFRQRVHPEDRERVTADGVRATNDKTPHTLRYKLLLPDGTIKYVLSNEHLIFDAAGELSQVIGTVIDVTEQHRSQEALEKAFEEIKVLKDQLYKENLALREEVDRASMFEEIVGESPALQSVLARVAKVGPTDSTVLITGETGTGKELIARAIHKRSRRSGRAFVSVNCSALAPALISSELFGHEKGAFTGATQRRLGRFELADGGTIFLDEVGEIPLDTQVALLRVLQEREFERVGGTQPVRADVRVIAATNRDLTAAIANGTFRQDLFYRLSVFPIEVPPLRKRKDDVLMLVEYFVNRYATRAGKNIRSIDKKTLEVFQSYDWPGNIRELQNVVERSVILTSGDVLRVDESWLPSKSSQRPSHVEAPGRPRSEREEEQKIIEIALRESRGRVSGPSGAAAKLKVPARTLENRIKALGIRKSQFKFG